MSAVPSALSADWDRVRKSLAAICVSHEELDRFFASTFDQLESLSAELVQRQRAFLAEREQAERELIQIQRQREALEVAQAEPAADPSREQQQQEIRRLQEERAGLVQERALLENDLESVRVRAAELTEHLAQQQRQMAEDRAQWADELKCLRHLVERLAQQNTERDTVAVASTATASRPVASEPAEPLGAVGDPVLDSVMAQFAMLQKDLQRRKAAAHAESK